MGIGEKNGNRYVAFKENDDLLAVPMDDVLWVMEVTQKTPKAIMPNASAHTRGIMELDGQLVTVLNLPEEYEDMQAVGKHILILDHADSYIGIIVSDVHLVKVPEQEISEDRLTGTKAFMCGGKVYSILDIYQLFQKLEIKIKEM